MRLKSLFIYLIGILTVVGCTPVPDERPDPSRERPRMDKRQNQNRQRPNRRQGEPLPFESAPYVPSTGDVEGYEPDDDLYIGMCAALTRVQKYDRAFDMRDTIVSLNHAMGIRNLRVGFQWKFIEPQKGQWEWAVYDSVVALAKRTDTRLFALIHSPPQWARPLKNHLDDWEHFVHRLAERYGEYVTDWEFWNEPNLDKYWPKDWPLNYYADALKITYRVIKSEIPGGKVILGGLAGSPTAHDYWSRLFKEGVLDYCDGVAMHPYIDPGARIVNYVNRLRSEMRKHTRRDLEIWISEFGMPFRKNEGEQPTEAEYALQADRILQTAAAFQAVRGSRYYVFGFRDVSETRSKFYGVYKSDFTPKPAVHALKWMVRTIRGYRPLNYEITESGSMVIKLVSRSGKTAFFSWGTERIGLVQKRMGTARFSASTYLKEYPPSADYESVRRSTTESQVIFWERL